MTTTPAPQSPIRASPTHTKRPATLAVRMACHALARYYAEKAGCWSEDGLVTYRAADGTMICLRITDETPQD